MSITKAGPGKWLIRAKVRIDGKLHEKKRKAAGTLAEAKAAEIRFIKEMKEAAGRSLTVTTFTEALQFYREHTTAKVEAIEWHLKKLEADLGNIPIKALSQKFGEYLSLLKKERSRKTGEYISAVTHNRLLVYAKIALNLCLKRGLITENPLKGLDALPETGRDRVLSPDEEWRLLDVLQRHNSYLLPAVKFSLKNPIRKGDLLKLRRENLDRIGRYVHLLPAKTRKKKPQKCFLDCIDDDMLAYFDSLPPESEYLFPRKVGDGSHDLGDFKNHWHTMLREARIDDFHWHDLKHCAITYMIDSGYTILDLKNLGIQFSEEMVERYYNFSAKKVIGKYRSLNLALTSQLKAVSAQ